MKQNKDYKNWETIGALVMKHGTYEEELAWKLCLDELVNVKQELKEALEQYANALEDVLKRTQRGEYDEPTL